jgi:hypothetical protein
MTKCCNLCDLQDYVCEVDPSVYSSMSYTTIEISSSLAAAQQQHIIAVSLQPLSYFHIPTRMYRCSLHAVQQAVLWLRRRAACFSTATALHCTSLGGPPHHIHLHSWAFRVPVAGTQARWHVAAGPW